MSDQNQAAAIQAALAEQEAKHQAEIKALQAKHAGELAELQETAAPVGRIQAEKLSQINPSDILAKRDLENGNVSVVTVWGDKLMVKNDAKK